MLAKATSRSASETPFTWSNRARALRTCDSSVSGSLRCSGKAKTESGKSFLSAVERSPWASCGFHVVLVMRGSFPPTRGAVTFDHDRTRRVRTDGPPEQPGDLRSRRPGQDVPGEGRSGPGRASRLRREPHRHCHLVRRIGAAVGAVAADAPA